MVSVFIESFLSLFAIASSLAIYFKFVDRPLDRLLDRIFGRKRKIMRGI